MLDLDLALELATQRIWHGWIETGPRTVTVPSSLQGERRVPSICRGAGDRYTGPAQPTAVISAFGPIVASASIVPTTKPNVVLADDRRSGPIS